MKHITLTFDNDPTESVTDRVLNLLNKRDVAATFFVVGSRLVNRSATTLLQEIASAGHWIGNHTLTHSVALGDMPDEEYARKEIEEAQTLIGVWPKQEKLFRPYGNDGLLGPHLFSESALSYLIRNDYTTVIWNIVPGDWNNPSGWMTNCITELTKKDWAVVVLHDIANAWLEQLPEFLSRISDLGIRIVQEFPDEVIVTRKGRTITLPNALVKGRLPH